MSRRTKNNAMPGSAASRQGPAQIKASSAKSTAPATDSRTIVIRRQIEADRIAKSRAPLLTTPPDRAARLATILHEAPGADGDTQRGRFERALQGGPITSHEARHYLDVLHPAGRVLALRRDGHNIVTRWVIQLSACGRLHRIGEWQMTST